MHCGPLSQRISTGLPRHALTCPSARLTRDAGKEKIHLNTQRFVVEVIDHIKQPHRATITELAIDEAHQPAAIGFTWVANSSVWFVPVSNHKVMEPR